MNLWFHQPRVGESGPNPSAIDLPFFPRLELDWRAEPSMNAIALAEAVDFYRIDASLKLDPGRRAALGQYMTPVPISRFMASLFSDTHGDLRILDPGAGVGSLTAALAERFLGPGPLARPRSVEFVCYEIDSVLSAYLSDTLRHAEARCEQAQVRATSRLIAEDFILEHGVSRQPELFGDRRQR